MVQALLMGLVAWVNGTQGPISWWLFREPVMAGFWVGLIYGKPVEGTIIGATINIAYLGWISTGGANASDLYWAGLLGTFVALKSGLGYASAAALSIPIGLLGNYVFVTYMTAASFWPNMMDKYAAKGNYKALRRVQILGGPALTFLLRALPVFLIALFGSGYIKIALNALPVWAMHGLTATGKCLPALGMSMLLKFMYKRELIPFFAIGFAVAAYSGFTNLMMYVIIAIAIAFVAMKMGFGNDNNDDNNGDGGSDTEADTNA